MRKHVALFITLMLTALLMIAGTAMADDTYTEGDWELRTLEDGTKEVVKLRNTTATEVVVPEGVTSISKGAFRDCTSLVNITMDYWLTFSNYDSILLIPGEIDQTTGKVTCAVAHCVSFGHYPQTADGTDSTPIEWIVLRKEGSKALLLSRYALDSVYFESPNVMHSDGLRWENSKVRRWLNDEFLHKAFTKEEQNAILKTNVDNSVGQGYSRWSLTDDPETVDQVFFQ